MVVKIKLLLVDNSFYNKVVVVVKMCVDSGE
jgi:hypothetical protein